MSWTEKYDNRSKYIGFNDDNNKTDNVESDIGPVGNLSSTLTEDASIIYNEDNDNVEENEKYDPISQQMDTLNIAQKPSSPKMKEKKEEEEEEDSLITIPFNFQKDSCDVWFKTRTGTVGFPSNYVKWIVKELQSVAIGDGIGDEKKEIPILEISSESLIHVISFYHPKDFVPWKGKVVFCKSSYFLLRQSVYRIESETSNSSSSLHLLRKVVLIKQRKRVSFQIQAISKRFCNWLWYGI